MRRVVTSIAVCGLLIGMVTVGAPPSQAQPASTGQTFGPAAVGQPVRPTIYRASLFQCPGTHCNQGEVSPPDDARLICKLPGYAWVLVLNRTTGHVGFIDRHWLSGIQHEPPSCYSTGIGTFPYWFMNLYQCPADFCNIGIAEDDDYVLVYCRLSGTDWQLLFNTVNLHVGWANSYSHGGGVPPPC